jgi:hypothetical protein
VEYRPLCPLRNEAVRRYMRFVILLFFSGPQALRTERNSLVKGPGERRRYEYEVAASVDETISLMQQYGPET